MFETKADGRYLVRGIDEDGFVVSETWVDTDLGVSMAKSTMKNHMGAATCSVFDFASPLGWELKGDNGLCGVFHKDCGLIPRIRFCSDPTRETYRYFESLSDAIAFSACGKDGEGRLEVGYKSSLGFARFSNCAIIEGLDYTDNVKVLAYCRQTKNLFGGLTDNCLLIALPAGETTEALNEIDHKTIWPVPTSAVTMCLYSMEWSNASSMFHSPQAIEPVFCPLGYDRDKGVFYKR